MSVQTTITEKLNQAFQPNFLEVLNESHNHNVPAGSESHFKITIATPQFEGKSLLARHRMINEVLSEELNGVIHALALHTLTPDEYFERAGKVADSPPCLGGSK